MISNSILLLILISCINFVTSYKVQLPSRNDGRYSSRSSSLVDSDDFWSSRASEIKIDDITTVAPITVAPVTASPIGLGINGLPKDCGKFFRPKTRIAGGRSARKGEFPSYVFIAMNGSASLFCGGSILSQWHVLTASHCVENIFKNMYRAKPRIYPTWILPEAADSEVPMHFADRVCMSDKFTLNSNRLRYDVAIFKLKKPIQFNEVVQPICLPDKDYTTDRDKTFTAIGLGKFNDFESSKVLQVMPFKVIPCRSADVHDTTVCMESKGPDLVGDTCAGDSGGGVIINDNEKHYLTSITSYGPDVCIANKTGYAVNANAHQLREEIDTLLKECN